MPRAQSAIPGAIPAFKGYHGFPGRYLRFAQRRGGARFSQYGEPLAEGDILSVDVGVLLDGYYGDGAFTIGVGAIDAGHQQFFTGDQRLFRRRQSSRPRPATISPIFPMRSNAAPKRGGYAIVRDFGGHGIGRALHEEPHLPNFGKPGRGPLLREGVVLAIEPILSMGKPEVEVAADGWTVLTRDRSLTAHFEHTVAITSEGAEILTLF